MAGIVAGAPDDAMAIDENAASLCGLRSAECLARCEPAFLTPLSARRPDAFGSQPEESAGCLTQGGSG
jgi:hypothetical protein